MNEWNNKDTEIIKYWIKDFLGHHFSTPTSTSTSTSTSASISQLLLLSLLILSLVMRFLSVLSSLLSFRVGCWISCLSLLRAVEHQIFILIPALVFQHFVIFHLQIYLLFIIESFPILLMVHRLLVVLLPWPEFTVKN